MKAGRAISLIRTDDPLVSYACVRGCVRLICAIKPLVFDLTALSDMSAGSEAFVQECLSGCESEVEKLYEITWRSIHHFENTYRLSGRLLQEGAE
mmetsp:Transcript_7942/g.19596  ORF Transcript_7942/g.19596 Transcript_7942/m.19596 type:complete len:95 (+) Transcript_7942:1702-1986(+)